MHNRLMINSERTRKGFGDSAKCGKCLSVTEDDLHVLRDCVVARNFWETYVHESKKGFFFFF